MPRTRRWTVLALSLAAPILLAQAALAQTPDPAAAPATPPHHKKSHKTQKQLVLPPLPAGPLSQLPMDQIPATPAKVSYQGGLLTISAQNSTLSEILRDVRKLTGASIEIPAGAGANERVVTHLGPGAPRDVLAVLLNGSSFNYVLLGSSADPTAIASVILLAKPSAAGETQTAANAYQNNPVPTPANGFPQPMPFNRPGMVAPQPGNVQPAADADDSKDDDDSADDSADDQTQPQPGQPGAAGANPQDQQQQPDANQPNAGPKTPEQILEMMQRQRQQQPGAPPVVPQQPPPD